MSHAREHRRSVELDYAIPRRSVATTRSIDHVDGNSNDLPDYELQPRHEELPREAPPRGIRSLILAAILLGATTAALYVALTKRPAPISVPTAPASAAETERPRSLGGSPEPIAVPPLNESDALVRRLVRALSDHPAVTAWVMTNGLIRNFTATVTNIANGTLPKEQLTALRPAAPFRVLENDRRLYIDPQTYNRWNAIADAVGSIDPGNAAKVYATLKPRIEEAFGELGYPNRRFDQVLQQAIVTVLHTPVPDRPPEVKRNEDAFGYGFADTRLENLSAAQKVLLRMGPRNARIVKTKLRDIGLALGIPAGDL